MHPAFIFGLAVLVGGGIIAAFWLRMLGRFITAAEGQFYGSTDADEIERQRAADRLHLAQMTAAASREQAVADLASARRQTEEADALAARLRELRGDIPEIVRNLTRKEK